jgi:hypothetical protein
MNTQAVNINLDQHDFQPQELTTEHVQLRFPRQQLQQLINSAGGDTVVLITERNELAALIGAADVQAHQMPETGPSELRMRACGAC